MTDEEIYKLSLASASTLPIEDAKRLYDALLMKARTIKEEIGTMQGLSVAAWQRPKAQHGTMLLRLDDKPSIAINNAEFLGLSSVYLKERADTLERLKVQIGELAILLMMDDRKTV